MRVEDAVNATKAAVEEGIVAGGGVTLLRIRKAIDELKLEGEQLIGANILRDALEKPLRVIVENSGEDSGKVLSNIERIQEEKKNPNIGFNVIKMTYSDMIEEGILDPAKVTRSALQNAVSVSTMILTTECLIAETSSEVMASKNRSPALISARTVSGPKGITDQAARAGIMVMTGASR